MDYHLTWYKCCPYWDDVQWPWPASIPQRSRSHKTFKGQSTHASVTCSYIQEYLGYRSNNLYFLFSHSWPVVVYTFCQVQRTSQVERKTKCSKSTTTGDIAVLWTALFSLSLSAQLQIINALSCSLTYMYWNCLSCLEDMFT